MVEKVDRRPTIKDLKRSRLYFGELEDALMHYSNPELEGAFCTITVRSGRDGKPRVEVVSETRFPAIDDIPDHLKRLHFVAERLDRLPAEFWELNNYYLGRKAPEDFPRLSMAVFLCGEGNDPNRRMELQEYFQRYSWDVIGIFTRDACVYDLSLRNFSWSNAKDPDRQRDDAEQCFRVMNAYIQLSKYFKKRGLPAGVTDF
ncbi:hypothetical protein HYS96_01160 [Candidatus Daviesbacteria bacterium]|nr:hypothetical protein [Candidatus Daviesbacteria bacterium]